MSPPQGLLCGLCSQLSRRASRISCCRAQCCWNCGVRFITRERKCWSCPSVSVLTQDLVKDTPLREQIKAWSSQKTAEPAAEQELQLPEPVPLLTNSASAASHTPQHVSPPLTSCGPGGEIAPSEPLAATETKEVGEVEQAITEPVAGDEAAGSEVKENIPQNFSQTIGEVKEDKTEDHSIETSTDNVVRDQPSLITEEPVVPNELAPVEPVVPNEPLEPVVSKEIVEPVVEILDEKPPDTDPTETELISSETIALLFDSAEEPKKSPVKIELKASFKKLSDRIQADTVPHIEEDLEMFENKNCRDLVEPEAKKERENVDDSTVESREIRILKVVDDEKTFDKINKIKVELDKTKQITSRRKSEDLKPTVKPFEVKPIKNALQGLQALLKMSGGQNPLDNKTKTDPVVQRERKEAKAENSKSRCDSKTDRRTSNSRSKVNEEKRSKGRSGSSQYSSKRHSKSRSPTKHTRGRSRSRSRSRTDRSQEEGNKEGLRHSSRSSSSRHSSSRSSRGRSRSRETSSLSSFKSTKINRAALVRDSRVEDDCKTLVENNTRDPDKATRATKKKSSDPKKQKKKVVEAEDDDIKVVSYKDVMPRCEDDGHIRIIRTIDNIEKEAATQTSKRGKRRASTSPEKSNKKVVSKFVEKERIVRKVYAVEKNVDGVSNFEKVTLEKSVKQTKEIHSQESSRDRDSVTPDDRKTSLEQIKEELERVKNRVDNMKNKPGQEESDSEVDMMSIMKDVKQMEAEVRDISEDVDVKVKSKKRKKEKEKADGGKSKEKEAEIKKVKEDKDSESGKRKKNNNETNKDIEIDSKLAKKILTSILGTNIGKTLNDVIRKEVDKTDHTIEKIKEDLKKQKEEKSKKKRRKGKEDKEHEGGNNKKFKTDEGQSSSRKDKKKSSLEIESKYNEEDHHHQPKKKSKKEKSKSPSRESRKKRKEGESKPVSKKKKSKSSRDKERHKKKKSKKKERRDYQSDSDHEETSQKDIVVDEKVKEDQEKATQDEFELVIGITEDDVAYLEKDEVSAKEKEEDLIVDKSDCRSGTDNDDGADSDDEVNLRALLLSQMARTGTPRRARSSSRAKISWPGSPRRQQSEEAESGVNYALPQYAYAFSRTFITHEEKQLYFPNLFSATLVELEYSESESECEPDCEEVWDQRRTTNWVSSRMADPRFSQAMESLLRQSRDSRSPEDYGY